MSDKKTLYSKPKYTYLAKIISLESPKKALDSASNIFKEFTQAVQSSKKTRILRATDLAMKRAEVGSTNPRISEKERKEYKVIAKIYKQTYDILKFQKNRDDFRKLEGKKS